MLYRFTGEFTNGRTSLVQWGIEFAGGEPREVPADLAPSFDTHPEFEVVDPLDHDGDGEKGGSLPKAKRGRPRKEAE